MKSEPWGVSLRGFCSRPRNFVHAGRVARLEHPSSGPSGHLLPQAEKGGSRKLRQLTKDDIRLMRKEGAAAERVISPLAGEMPGRAEGGAVPQISPPNLRFPHAGNAAFLHTPLWAAAHRPRKGGDQPS